MFGNFATLVLTAVLFTEQVEAGERRSSVRRESRKAEVAVGARATLEQLVVGGTTSDATDSKGSVSISAGGEARSEKTQTVRTTDAPEPDDSLGGGAADGDDNGASADNDSANDSDHDGRPDEDDSDGAGQGHVASMQVLAQLPEAASSMYKREVPEEGRDGEADGGDEEHEHEDDAYDPATAQENDDTQQATNKDGLLTPSGKAALSNAVDKTTEVLRKARAEDEKQRQRLVSKVSAAEESIRKMDAEMQIARVLEDGVKAQTAKIHNFSQEALQALQDGEEQDHLEHVDHVDHADHLDHHKDHEDHEEERSTEQNPE